MATDLLDNPLFCALAVFFTLLFLLNLKSLLKVMPSLWDCAVRWKGNLDLEDSIQLSRSRNWIAAILFVPFCLLVYSAGLYSPDFLNDLPQTLRIGVVIGIFLAYLLLRTFLNWQLEMHNFGSAAFTAANRSFYNYYVILFFLLLFSAGLIRLLGGSPGTVRSILLWETGVSYVVFIFRRGQIFASVCNPFSTFLYLCSLELLPTAALVVSEILL